MEDKTRITQEVMDLMKPAKVFNHYEAPINSLDISRDGKYCVTASCIGTIDLYDIIRGEKLNTYKIKYKE